MDDSEDDTGLYDDLVDVDLGDLVSKLENDKQILSKQIKSLEGDVERLISEIISMKETEKRLSRNISELYKTAKSEIERKDRMINTLQTEKDDLLFRRTNRAAQEKQNNDHVNVNRIKLDVLDETPSKKRKLMVESHVGKIEPGRHSPRRRGSSDSRDYKDRHSSYRKDNYRHRETRGGSGSRRCHVNEGRDRNRSRSRYRIKGEESDRSTEHKHDCKQSSDTSKFKYNSITKPDVTKHTKESSRGKDRIKTENVSTSEDFRKHESESSITKPDVMKHTKESSRGKDRIKTENISTSEDFRKHESESSYSDTKRKCDLTRKSTIEKENDRSNVNGPSNTLVDTLSKNLQSNARTNDSKPMNFDNSSHLKNVPKAEDKSSFDRKKGQPIMKPFSFFDKTLSPMKDKNPVNLPQPMDCDDQLHSKIEPKGVTICSSSRVDDPNMEQRINFDVQKLRHKDGSTKEKENLTSPRRTLMNYLEIQPKRENGKEKSTTATISEKLASDYCDKKLKSKTSTQEKSGSSNEKSKLKIEKKRNASSSKGYESKTSSDGRDRSEKERKSDSKTDKVMTKRDKTRSRDSERSSSRKHESKEKRKRRKSLNGENESPEYEVSYGHLFEERERIRQLLEQASSSDDENSNCNTKETPANDAQVTFLANVHISPVIKAKKGATNRLQECIEKLGERENSTKNVITSNNNPEENHNNVATKNENSMEVTSSYIDDPIGSPTSSTNQIITKRTPRLANLIDKLSAKGPNSSKYNVFAENANEAAHSTLNNNDCHLSSTNTTIIDENVLSQPGTSAMNDSTLVLPQLPIANNNIIKNQPDTSDSTTAKHQLSSRKTIESNSVNTEPLEGSNTIVLESNIANNNVVLEKNKTDSVDHNISSSSEHLNNSNSTLVLHSNLSLSNSSENNSSVRTVFNNRRRRCVVKIVN